MIKIDDCARVTDNRNSDAAGGDSSSASGSKITMTDDDLDFYYEQVVNIHEFGANATFETLREHIRATGDRQIVQLTEALATLVERGRVEYIEVDRKARWAGGSEMAYVPVRKTGTD